MLGRWELYSILRFPPLYARHNKRTGDAKRRPFLAFVSNYCTPEGMVPDRAAQGRSGSIPGLPGSAPATLGVFNRYTSTRSLACDLFDGSMWRVNNYLTGCTRRARKMEAELYRGYWGEMRREMRRERGEEFRARSRGIARLQLRAESSQEF